MRLPSGSDPTSPESPSRPDRRWCSHVFAATLSFALASAAPAAEVDESQHWVPSFGVFFDMLGQKIEGAVTTGQVMGPPLTEGGCLRGDGSRTGTLCATARANPAQIMPDDEGNDTSVTPLVGASLELMTPSPFEGWLRPRIFVHGDGAAAFGFERNVAGVEGPDEFALPPGIVVEPGLTPEQKDLEELSIKGQGSRARTQVRRLVWSAGGGIAVSFDVLGRRLRLKPSVEYLHQELDLIGVVHRAVKLRQPSGVADLSGFRQLSLTREEKESYDGIGPGLELEVDAARLGPFVSSVYLMGRGYHLFGDLETTFSETNEFGETATWTFRPESWVWRSGVGVRFRWVPEAG